MQPHCRITWLLEFTDPNLETSWRQYRLNQTYLASDAAVLIVNAVANATMLLRLRMLADLPTSSRLGLLANLLLSIAHALLVRNAPRRYMHWRTTLVSVARVLRMLVVLSMSSLNSSQPGTWLAMALHFIMLSPATASFLCAVALPLPLRPHLALQALITAITVTQVDQLCQQVPAGMQDVRCSVLALLSERVKWLNPFDLGLMLPGSSAASQDCCVPVLAAVMVAYGMVFSSLAVYTIDLVSRTNFLRRTAQLPGSSVATLIRVMRAVWLVSCLIALSSLPVVWEAGMLWHKLSQTGLAGYGMLGLGAAVTSLLIESFMRVWFALVLLIMCSMFFVFVGE